MPIVILCDCDRESAELDWGLLSAHKSDLSEVYHVQDSSTSQIGLESAGIMRAKYVLIVADPNAGVVVEAAAPAWGPQPAPVAQTLARRQRPRRIMWTRRPSLRTSP